MSQIAQVTAFAPGKLYIAGEYAVTVPGNPALLVAVDRGITAQITAVSAADKCVISSDFYGALPVSWSFSNGVASLAWQPYDYLAAAITLGETLRQELGFKKRNYSIEIVSTLRAANGEKYGLGSSGAVVVAVLQALNKFYGLQLSLFRQYQLALLASITVSAKGSGGDIAASVFGGWISYCAPDRNQLKKLLGQINPALAQLAGVKQESNISAESLLSLLDNAVWRQAEISAFAPAAGVELLVGWTGSAANTDEMLARAALQNTAYPPAAQASNRQNAKLATVNSDTAALFGETFLKTSKSCVQRLKTALFVGDSTAVAAQIARSAKLLNELSQAQDFTFETPKLRQLQELANSVGAAAKISGAGGGDCGIALSYNSAISKQVRAAWERAQIKPLDLNIQPAAA